MTYTHLYIFIYINTHITTLLLNLLLKFCLQRCIKYESEMLQLRFYILLVINITIVNLDQHY
jgi:hypothetical protein